MKFPDIRIRNKTHKYKGLYIDNRISSKNFFRLILGPDPGGKLANAILSKPGNLSIIINNKKAKLYIDSITIGTSPTEITGSFS